LAETFGPIVAHLALTAEARLFDPAVGDEMIRRRNQECEMRINERPIQARTPHQITVMALIASLVAAWPVTAERPHGNAVTNWNAVAAEAFEPTQGTNPLAQSRTLAILHAAIHDVLNAIDRRFEPYTPGLAPAPGASPDAAVAAVAREVLIALVPEQTALVDAAYERALRTVPDGPSKAAGLSAGRAAAIATLTRRHQDGLDTATQPTYVPRQGPGEYQFTPPFDFANLPGWGGVHPFVINLQQHLVDGPQPLSSHKYARDLAYVRAIGAIDSATRTPDQSEIAQFWYEDSPLGWNRIANTVVRQQRLDPWVAARAFALVNFALADGFIAGFDAKYQFRFWRPVTAIHDAGTDGNPLTEEDPTWQPFLVTPPVPDYPSTHTVLGAAAAEVLIRLFGDKVPFSTTSLTLPGVTRGFKGFSAAAEENGLSRVYAGIHFQHAVRDGYRQGQSIGRAVARSLEPVR
jgi:membrane-associated phospholipid phosphatase